MLNEIPCNDAEDRLGATLGGGLSIGRSGEYDREGAATTASVTGLMGASGVHKAFPPPPPPPQQSCPPLWQLWQKGSVGILAVTSQVKHLGLLRRDHRWLRHFTGRHSIKAFSLHTFKSSLCLHSVQDDFLHLANR